MDDGHYNNILEYDEDKLMKVVLSGRGGRSKVEGAYVHTHNQEIWKNYPILVSEQHGLPIRLLTKANNKITYRGLWKAVGHSYSSTDNSNNMMMYQFTLLPW